MMAFLMFKNPIAEKLEHYTREETANMVVVIEGIDSIVKGYNAMIIKEKLKLGSLPRSARRARRRPPKRLTEPWKKIAIARVEPHRGWPPSRIWLRCC